MDYFTEPLGEQETSSGRQETGPSELAGASTALMPYDHALCGHWKTPPVPTSVEHGITSGLAHPPKPGPQFYNFTWSGLEAAVGDPSSSVS